VRFTKPKKVVGLDIGTHAVKAVQMSRSGDSLCIEDAGYALVDPSQVNVDPIAAQADALREALRRISVNQSMIVGALPGQTVVIRYPRLRDIPVDEIDGAIESEASQNIPYDLSEVFLDWSLLAEETEGTEKLLKILLVAAKNEVIDSRVQVADAAEISFNILGVDSLALIDAAEGCHMLKKDESVALINLGASSVSIHFTKDGVSNFIRDISWGAKEMINAIAKARRCEFEEAEAILFNLETELAKSSQAVEAMPVPEVEVEPATPPPLGGQDSSSTLESLEGGLEDLGQKTPAIDGPEDLSSVLEPLEEELDGLVPAIDEPEDLSSVLEPLEGELDTLGSSTPTVQDARIDDLSGVTPLEEILAMPIAKLVAEVRRSFDYYEHQLYERPVERIILSGGIAHIPSIQEALRNDLGIEDVVVANPCQAGIRVKGTTNAPEFEEHPAQFMVAIGLAARGAAEL